MNPKKSPSWFEKLQTALQACPTIHHLNWVTVGDVWGQREHTTKAHELIHVLEGRAKIVWGHNSVSVKPGDTFLVPKELPHRDVRQSPPPYRAFYIHFLWPSGNALLQGLPLQQLLRAPDSVKRHWKSLIKEMEDTFSGDALNADQQLRVQLFELLVSMSRHALVARIRGAEKTSAQSRGTRQRRTQLATEARCCLEEWHAQSFSLDDLADHLEVSPFHLCRVYSKEFGHSITDALTDIRIEGAKELLRTTSLSIKEVATQSGFSNANYFAKVFRRLTGASPSAFQAKAKKKRKNVSR